MPGPLSLSSVNSRGDGRWVGGAAKMEREKENAGMSAQDSSAKAKTKRHVEIYILADGSTRCQRKKLK